MGKLILMRHAKSDWHAGRPDIERPLNTRGKRAAVAMGHWLREHGHVPTQAIVSTSQRTRETWELLGFPFEPEFSESLYHASPETVLNVVQSANETDVLILGHNPGLAILAVKIVQAPPAHHRFMDYPAAATLVAEFDSPWKTTKPGTGRALNFVVPKDLM